MDTSSAVRSLFLGTFGIEPDPGQLDDAVAEVGDDPAALLALADRLYRFARHCRETERETLPDHSQFGELRILLREMMRIGRRNGIIVDVGVLGSRGSNSYDLLTTFGWTGLLVEANPALLPDIRLQFGPADYRLIGCAVGVDTGRHLFHLGPQNGTSSLLREHVDNWGVSPGTIEVEVRRLHDILSEAEIPVDVDILDIDIEGMDVTVMNDLVASSAYRPRLVVIEGSYLGKTQSLAELGASTAFQNAYRIIDKTAANLILEFVSD